MTKVGVIECWCKAAVNKGYMLDEQSRIETCTHTPQAMFSPIGLSRRQAQCDTGILLLLIPVTHGVEVDSQHLHDPLVHGNLHQ